MDNSPIFTETSSGGTPAGPVVSVSFAAPRRSFFPRLDAWRRASEPGAKRLLIVLAALWVFGGAAFFMLRLTAHILRGMSG
jgi:hypothetical protein